jgi:ubiquinone/menaquinone biosynthesis C-methylase UbiE
LDAGCGVGWFGKFRPAQVKVYGVDCNPEEVRIASKYETSVVGDIRNLPYQDECFDGIFCHHVLEHLEEPEKAANEFFRVLNKGGIVIAEVPSKWDPNAYRDSIHKQFFNIESLSRIFEEAGFKILDCYYCALEIKAVKNKLLYEFLSSIGRSLAKKLKKMRRAIRIYAKK